MNPSPMSPPPRCPPPKDTVADGGAFDLLQLQFHLLGVLAQVHALRGGQRHWGVGGTLRGWGSVMRLGVALGKETVGLGVTPWGWEGDTEGLGGGDIEGLEVIPWGWGRLTGAGGGHWWGHCVPQGDTLGLGGDIERLGVALGGTLWHWGHHGAGGDTRVGHWGAGGGGCV